MRSNRPSPILMLAPVAIVLIGYNYSYHFPQQRTLNETQEKLTKLRESREEVDKRFGKISTEKATARKELRSLEEELNTFNGELANLESQRKRTASQMNVTESPADSIDQALQILERHDILVLESATGSDHKPDEILKPIQSLLKASPQNNKSLDIKRHVYQIRLVGSFDNLSQSLEEIIEQLPQVVVLSAELESVALDTPVRQWTIAIMV